MLGVEIDQHLTWKSNTEVICKKVTSGIFVFRRLKQCVDNDTLLSVYNSVVRRYFNIALKFGTCLEKLSPNGYKSSKTDQLGS